MANYVVSYDLTGPVRDYDKLITKLRSYPNWAKVLESVWIISTPLTASGLYSEIAPFIDGDDKLFIVKAQRDASWTGNIGTEVGDWMQKYL